MKRFFIIAILAMLSMACMAQSSEAGYPVGTWQSAPEADVFVDMTIDRVTAPNPDFGNKKICGTLSIDGNPSYEASLTYSGRGIDNKDMPMDVFFFNVVSRQNKTSKIAIRKMLKEEGEFGNVVKIKIVQVTGDLANNTAMKQQLYSFAFNAVTISIVLIFRPRIQFVSSVTPNMKPMAIRYVEISTVAKKS